MTELSFPSVSIHNKKFQEDIFKYYENNKDLFEPPIANSSRDRCNRRADDAKTLTLAQLLIHDLTINMQKHHNSTARGLLCWHSTGSGKTCLATGIMDAYLDNPYNYNIIYLSSKDALRSNPPSKFMDCAKMFFPQLIEKLEKGINKKSNKQKRHNKDIDALLTDIDREIKSDEQKLKGGATINDESLFSQNNIRFLTFAKLARLIGVNKPRKKTEPNVLRNSVLIIDEVQNIFKPLPHQRAEHLALKQFLLGHDKDDRLKNSKVFILTATPGDTPESIVELLNIIRPSKNPPITLPSIDASVVKWNEFRNSIRGLISYMNLSSDLSKFPRLIKKPPYRAYMSNVEIKDLVTRANTDKSTISTADKKMAERNQFLQYLIKMREEEVKAQTSDIGDYDKLLANGKLGNYYNLLRKYSNMLYNIVEGMNIQEFSSKLPMLIENIINNNNQKHYIYTSFYERPSPRSPNSISQGLVAIATVLAREYEYAEFSVELMQKIDLKTFKGKAGSGFEGKRLKKAKRFITLGLTYKKEDEEELTPGDRIKDIERAKKLVEFYNSPLNKRGEYIQLVLASRNFNESIDLKGVRHLHLFEPMLSWISRQQAIGRAVRQCSHADLDKNKGEWKVVLHEYISDKPFKITLYDKKYIDDQVKMLENSSQKQREEIDRYQTKLQKDTFTPKLREFYEKKIKENKENVKRIDRRIIAMHKLREVNQIKMIDDKVYELSKEKFKEMATLDRVMKESAIDCKLFAKLHKGENIKCA